MNVYIDKRDLELLEQAIGLLGWLVKDGDSATDVIVYRAAQDLVSEFRAKMETHEEWQAMEKIND
jgi:hypothetical protein